MEGFNPSLVLRLNIERAVRYLAPKFQVSDWEIQAYGEPAYIVDEHEETASYCHDDREFIFNPLLLDDIEAIGEETSHYLHHIVNNLEDNFDTDVLTEVIGRYGGLCYQYGCPRNIAALLRNGHQEIAWPPSSMSFWELWYDSAVHDMSYARAEIIFRNHGDSLLPRLARMSVDESLKFLPLVAPVTFYERRVLPYVSRLDGYKLEI